MIVVADTSCLNYLVRMARAEILHELYQQVTIPHAVRDEMLAAKAPDEVRLWAEVLPEWIVVQSAMNANSTLPWRLGAGEREAILLAEKIHADVLQMDDRRGRLAAEAMGLFVAGTLAVVLQPQEWDELRSDLP